MRYLDAVLEEVATFLKKLNVEIFWWHRMPLGDEYMHHKTDNVLPSLSMLFGIINQAVRVIFLNADILKTQGNECKLHANGVESFKSYNQFDNNHLEFIYFRKRAKQDVTM